MRAFLLSLIAFLFIAAPCYAVPPTPTATPVAPAPIDKPPQKKPHGLHAKILAARLAHLKKVAKRLEAKQKGLAAKQEAKK